MPILFRKVPEITDFRYKLSKSALFLSKNAKNCRFLVKNPKSAVKCGIFEKRANSAEIVRRTKSPSLIIGQV